jgi:hypothetical protein
MDTSIPNVRLGGKTHPELPWLGPPRSAQAEGVWASAVPTSWADGGGGGDELDYRWLSRDCTRPEDGAFRCVQGSETTYWQRKELGRAFAQAIKAETLNHFNHFQPFC